MNEKYPMLEKIKEMHEKSQICGEFLEFVLHEYEPEELSPWDIEKYLANFFGVDQDQAEKERQALLNSVRFGG